MIFPHSWQLSRDRDSHAVAERAATRQKGSVVNRKIICTVLGHVEASPAWCLTRSRGSINDTAFLSFSSQNRYEFFFFFISLVHIIVS